MFACLPALEGVVDVACMTHLSGGPMYMEIGPP
jgi:hypothetical protein